MREGGVWKPGLAGESGRTTSFNHFCHRLRRHHVTQPNNHVARVELGSASLGNRAPLAGL